MPLVFRTSGSVGLAAADDKAVVVEVDEIPRQAAQFTFAKPGVCKRRDPGTHLGSAASSGRRTPSRVASTVSISAPPLGASSVSNGERETMPSVTAVWNARCSATQAPLRADVLDSNASMAS